MNSDTVPDACRSDCTNPSCGDGVMDSNEECDDGNQNDDEIPDACRTNCLNAYCGDGVVDPYYEECDNGVNDGSQGCYQCMRCYLPSDDLHIREDAKLCEGTYTIADEGSEGVIVVSEDGNAESVTLNCNDAKLIGVDVEMAQMGQVNMNNDMMSTQFNNQNSEPNTQSMQSNIQSMEMTDQETNQESTGFMAQLFGLH